MPGALEIFLGALDVVAREFPDLPIVTCGTPHGPPEHEEEEGAVAWTEPAVEALPPS